MAGYRRVLGGRAYVIARLERESSVQGAQRIALSSNELWDLPGCRNISCSIRAESHVWIIWSGCGRLCGSYEMSGALEGMLMRVIPTGGRGTGGMGIFLMRFLCGGLFLLSAGAGLLSCAGNHYSRPESWPKPPALAKAPCDSIAGIYREQGAGSCEWFSPGFKSLSYILEPCLFPDLTPAGHLKKADRAEDRRDRPGPDRLGRL
jgi:hypothetical protein